MAVEALLELSEERLLDDSRLSFSEDLEGLVAALAIIVGRLFLSKDNNWLDPSLETKAEFLYIFFNSTPYCFSSVARDTNLSDSPVFFKTK